MIDEGLANEGRTPPNYVGGRWVSASGERTLDVLNPATQARLERVPLCAPEDLNGAVSAARGAFAGWRSVSTIERARWLFSLREALGREHEELARLVVTEMGKTLAAPGAGVGGMSERGEAAPAVPTTMGGRGRENAPGGVDCKPVPQPVGV